MTRNKNQSILYTFTEIIHIAMQFLNLFQQVNSGG